jgi:CheY-like chemotaxis protein
LYREVLAQRGWAVTAASDGREALVLALSAQPSIIVMELRLAFIDGASLCRLLRRDGLTSNVPILVVTGESRTTYLKQAKHAGANAVLIKPSTPDVIVAEMDRLTKTTAAFAQSPPPRKSLVKAHQRFETTTPNERAPDLLCPICTTSLVYQKSFFGGVSNRQPERWDYLKCPRCGEFTYRYRTRKLRHLA